MAPQGLKAFFRQIYTYSIFVSQYKVLYAQRVRFQTVMLSYFGIRLSSLASQIAKPRRTREPLWWVAASGVGT